MQICHFYLQSRCRKGAHCSFRHEQVAATSPAAAGNLHSESAATNLTKTPCSFFLQGRCRNGDKCTFEHASSAPIAAPPADVQGLVPCRFFAAGHCANGADCGFYHAESDKTDLEADTNPEKIQELLARTVSGASAEFADGGRVSKFSLASDFSAIRINGIPANTTPGRISQILHNLGHEVSNQSIRILAEPQFGTLYAHVTARDPGFAHAVCSAKHLLPASFEAIPTPPRLPFWAAKRRVNCKKVMVSWHRPTRLTWLNFSQGSTAERVASKFNKGQYKIQGESIKASIPTGAKDRHNHQAWTVSLQNVPCGVWKFNIHDAITEEYDKPQHIELGKGGVRYDVQASQASVESLLSAIGPVEFNVIPQAQGKRVKAIALFPDEEDAREAVTSLNGKPQAFLHDSRLSVQLMSSSKFKVSTKCYKHVKDELSVHATSWHEQHLAFRTYADPKTQFTTLKIEGEAVKDLAAAANTIEHIISGVPILDEGTTFWVPSLVANGTALQKLREIAVRHGVSIERNKHKRELRYFGSASKLKAIRREIVEALRQQEHAVHVIPLDGETFVWACRGGFNLITDTIGAEAVSFDIVCVPKRIIVTGSEKLYLQALEIVGQKQTVAGAANTGCADQDCAICWTPAEEPVTTECGHIYCLDCYKQLCMSGDSTNADFLITCPGDAGTCGKVVSTGELQTHLSSAALEEVLEASATSHVRRRPHELRYCPSPDCGEIYRATTISTMHTCAKCFERVCTACHEQHGNMSCADYKDLASGGYEAFEKFKREMSIKDCPKCKTPLEKTEGCNHMTCGGCRTHICWVCMKIFDTSGPCYEHMNAAHGGIGLDQVYAGIM